MRLLMSFAFLFFISATQLYAAPAGLPKGLDAENTLVLTLKDGTVLIKLRPDLAPKHVERIKMLTRKGFYNGVVFHRVIEGFMAQTGDPTGTGTGGSDQPDLKAEFTSAPFKRGTVGMARNGPGEHAETPETLNSANSQWFICFAATPSLNGQYTVWGEVVQGMEFVDKIKRGQQGGMGLVKTPQDKIISLSLASDVKPAAAN